MLNLNSLNDKQRQAVTNESGNLLVLAGPGSGKTFTIVQRIFYLLEVKKVPPEEILVITFTKDSAVEMQNRFLNSSDSIYPVAFGTFHSVFYHILCDGNKYSYNILDSFSKRKIISDIISTSIKIFNKENNRETNKETNKGIDKTGLTDSFINAISFYKNTLDFEKSILLIEEEYSVFFKNVLTEYEKRRQSIRAIDFDDMVYDCLNLLAKNKIVLDRWRGKFTHILIDEFQDINHVQYEVIKKIAGNNTRLFLVGDDDQSIYCFRGAAPECMKLAIKEFNCKTINLKYNYRNPEEIRCAAEKIITENSSRIYKVSESVNAKSESKHIEIFSYETKEEHYEKIAEFIHEQIHNSIHSQDGYDCAVLFRTNIEMQRLAVLMSKKGIPFVCKEKRTNIYDHFIVKDIMAYLKLAYDTCDDDTYELIGRIINKPVRLINREALIGPYHPLDNIVDYYKKIEDKIFSKKIINKVNILKKDLSFISERSLFPAIVYVLRKIGYEKYLFETVKHNAEKGAEYAEIIDWLLDDAKKHESLDEYIEAQKEYLKNLSASTADDNSIKNADSIKGVDTAKAVNSVKLMTVHASKGLEFKNVIIAGCNDGNFPKGKMPDKDTLEEERRLFYVAMTRSSENLYLFYVKGTKERIAIPSRFIGFLLDKK